MAAHIGADSRQLVFSPEDVANAWVDSVWATEGLESGMTAPLWCLFREMRSHGALAAIGGQCADALLCGHPRHLDWPMHQVNDLLFDEFQRTRLPGLLRLYDRCAMAHGVELRMPFLDWRLVAFASALPPEAKIGQGFTQRVLRDAMAGILPEPIRLRRTKVGFDDTQALLNGCLAPLVRRAVDHPLWVDSPLWNGPVLRDQILARTTAQAWTEADSAVWPMINLVLWQMLFIERRTPALLWG
jgi:asparagine synthetase B (glutamine-hydrolysing)